MDDSPTFLAALGAGVLSSVSAAVVPLLPGFLAYTWNRGALEVSAFLLGFSLVFVGLGAGATVVGQTLLEHLTLFERVAGVLLVLLGLWDMGVPGIAKGRSSVAREPAWLGLAVSLAAGGALTFGWTPLAGPVLDRILATSTSAATIGRGVGLLSTYAAGRALPLLVAGLALGAFHGPATAGAGRTASKLISGGLIALTGVLIFTGLFPWIVARLAPLLPLA
jgi:cytochrome c-type biogenesis protein